MADIKAAEKRGDVVDGVPVGQSSNPYDYVGISPRLHASSSRWASRRCGHRRARSRPATENGLREYLLAAAGAQIDGDTPGSGAQTWSDGKEWARQYREDALSAAPLQLSARLAATLTLKLRLGLGPFAPVSARVCRPSAGLSSTGRVT